jgi:hypothetical protein
MRHRHRVVEPYLAEVFEFILADHRSDREAAEFVRRESVLGEKRQAHICRQVEVRGVRQVAVEVHCPQPARNSRA